MRLAVREIASQYAPEALAKLVTLMRTSTDEVVSMKAALELIDRGYGRPTLAAPAPPPPAFESPTFNISFEDGGPGDYGSAAQEAASIYQRVIRGDISAEDAAAAVDQLHVSAPLANADAEGAATPTLPAPILPPRPLAAPAPAPAVVAIKPTPPSKPNPEPVKVHEPGPEDILPPRLLSTEEAAELALHKAMGRTRVAEMIKDAERMRDFVETSNERERRQMAEREANMAKERW